METRSNHILVGGVVLASQADPLWGGVGVGGSLDWDEDRLSLYGEASLNSSLSAIGESYSLEAGLPAKRTATGRVELRDVVARDWQNDYAQFLTNLKQELQEVETGARRREAIARMRSVLDEYAAHRKKHRKTG